MLGKKESESGAGYRVLLMLLSLVIVAWALGGGVVYWMNPDWLSRGPAGDMFGAVNALFTGCAFAALIFTIRQQSQELALQREELKLTRGELAGQRAQMESQASTLKLQQFESTFFQLLRVHDEIVNAIDLQRTQGVTKGRDCFKIFCRRFGAAMLDLHAGSKTEAEQIHKAYESFYQNHESEVGHYFRHLYHVIKFVDSSEVENKRRYTSFVRAQLSSYELELLFYNCLTEYGNLRFKPLVEKYGLLKHLSNQRVKPHQRQYYRASAFLSADAN